MARLLLSEIPLDRFAPSIRRAAWGREPPCHPDKIYIGGIMVTIMPDRVQRELGKSVHILTGLLTDSALLNLNDHINIDELSLDYSILDESEYKYPVEENYFSYTTRGCPNKCTFCAVPILEPEYKITNNIYHHRLPYPSFLQ